MAYEKTNWQTGDVITAAKLNNMEGGIEAAQPMYLSTTNEWQDETSTHSELYAKYYTLDYGVAPADVLEAVQAGKFVSIKKNDLVVSDNTLVYGGQDIVILGSAGTIFMAFDTDVAFDASGDTLLLVYSEMK